MVATFEQYVVVQYMKKISELNHFFKSTTIKPIPLKALRKQRHPQNSFFRWSLDNLRDWLTQPFKSSKMFKQFTKWLLIPTPENAF
ncbi:MAG: hypothetical protein CMF38_06250 [Legionellaceae bacterium]|nr:hypothetical protein [Legionellaceae bacterium]HAF87955.1 hypothetical protein [Legionellales bacterium]HCA89121.1 hypothetical protein [Legionellales bacterium]|tara:strand:- start:4625 stop:4882 length:258 start_codon:yes stop_codon:yes gene_type:complete